MRYRSVVFLDSPEDFDRWYEEMDSEGIDSGFEYLLQWEYGEGCEESETIPWGSLDVTSVHWDGDNQYVVSYNWNLQCVSLTEILED